MKKKTKNSDSEKPNQDNQSLTGQAINAENQSSVSNVAQSKIEGNVVNSLVVVAGGNVVINKSDNKIEYFDELSFRKLYLEAIIKREKYERWGNIKRYIELSVSPYGNFDSQPDQTKSHKNVGDVIEENIYRNRPVLLVGPAGAGKTSTLEKFMYELAKRGLANKDIPIPVLLPLNRYDGDLLSLFRAVMNETGGSNLSLSQIEIITSTLNVLVMFDGINELGEFRTRGIKTIQNFIGAHQTNHIILTCRKQDYRNEFDEYIVWEIKKINRTQIFDYLVNNYGIRGKTIYNNVVKDDKLLELASNPLLLYMLANATLSDKSRQNKGLLYRDFIQNLFSREGRKGEDAQNIPIEVKIRALSRLAFKMQMENTLIVNEKKIILSFTEYLEKWSETYSWRKILDEITLNGLLIKINNNFSFPHQSYQEYFAACEIDYSELADELLDFIIRKPEWKEVIWFLSGITSQPSILIKKLLGINPLSAAYSIYNGADPGIETLKSTIDALGLYAEQNNWAIKRTCADLMGKLKSQFAYQYLISMLKDNNSEVRWGAIYSLRQIGINSDVIRSLIPLLEDKRDVIQGEAAMTLGEFGAVDAIQYLGPLLGSIYPYVRASAVYALVKLRVSFDTPGMKSLLENKNPIIALLSGYVIEIVKGEDDHSFLIKSLSDSNLYIREAAIMLLVRYGRINAIGDISNLLSDKVSSVRAAAAGAIGKLKGIEYIPRIVELLHNDESEIVRHMAANSLHWMQAIDSTQDLISAISDPYFEVRVSSIRALGEFRTLDAVPSIKERAESDSNKMVRLQAIRSLALYGIPDILDILYKLLENDADDEVIQSVSEAIDSITRRDRFVWY